MEIVVSGFRSFFRTWKYDHICNFYIHYEVDDDKVPTVLELAEYDGEDEGCWVLLEPVAAEAEA